MVRDSGGSHDGWYWGWFGWGKGDWRPDWPAPEANDYPYMGFGLYCTNCHASARDNYTFASLRNIKGHPGDPWCFSARPSCSIRMSNSTTKRSHRRSRRRSRRQTRPTRPSSRSHLD